MAMAVQTVVELVPLKLIFFSCLKSHSGNFVHMGGLNNIGFFSVHFIVKATFVKVCVLMSILSTGCPIAGPAETSEAVRENCAWSYQPMVVGSWCIYAANKLRSSAQTVVAFLCVCTCNAGSLCKHRPHHAFYFLQCVNHFPFGVCELLICQSRDCCLLLLLLILFLSFFCSRWGFTSYVCLPSDCLFVCLPVCSHVH